VKRCVRAGAGFRIGLVLLASCAPAASPLPAPAPAPPLVQGLDHVPVAVRDLDRAADDYRALGFALKPGRPHDNGIRNLHVKFENGTEIELITAPEALDELTTEYRHHLAEGEGPAFLGLFAPDTARIERKLGAAGIRAEEDGGLIGFSSGEPLHALFFGRRQRSPTDKPEHFAHPNTAESLIGVFWASDDVSAQSRLFEALDVVAKPQTVCAPGVTRAAVARLPEGEVVFLPGSRQVVPGHFIAGAISRVRDLEAAQAVMASHGVRTSAIVHCGDSASLFLTPEQTHGLWLELLQTR
jgi:hypothetical protein